MVNVKKFKTVKYLAAKEAGEHNGKKFIIDTAFPAMIQENEKICVRLKGVEQPIVLNQTNLSLLSSAYTDDTENWIGKKVVFVVASVLFNGEMKPSIQLQPTE